MPQYICRVELHDAVWSDYNKLHEAMKREGFSQTIAADDGAIYELPPAEYNYVGQENRVQVLEKVKRTARTVKPSFAALVTQSNGINWFGLRLVKKAAA
jgi:Endoribonuclease GhoS